MLDGADKELCLAAALPVEYVNDRLVRRIGRIELNGKSVLFLFFQA